MPDQLVPGYPRFLYHDVVALASMGVHPFGGEVVERVARYNLVAFRYNVSVEAGWGGSVEGSAAEVVGRQTNIRTNSSLERYQGTTFSSLGIGWLLATG